MTVQDKHNLLQRINDLESVILELGCGPNKRTMNAIGVDAIDYDCVDIVGDALEVLERFPDSSVDAIHSFHFFEHMPDVSVVLDAMARVIRPGGKLEIVVPHFSNPYFYSDYTHKTFFGLYTLSYLSRDRIFRNRVPTYKKSLFFNLDTVRLGFKSPRPFYGRYALKKALGLLFNSCTYMQELYEENFCYLFPCYEVKYQLTRLSLAS
jgi:SAM-dependent methyltransferase